MIPSVLDERDHLFQLAGHHPATRGVDGDHVSSRDAAHPQLSRVTPADIVTELVDTRRQAPLGVAQMGDLSRHVGPSRSIGHG